MKRDMDIIRLLLLQQETGEEPEPFKHGTTSSLVVYNASPCYDAGFIAQILSDSSGSLHEAQLSSGCTMGQARFP